LKRYKLYWTSQVVGWGTYVALIAVFNRINGNEFSTELSLNLISTFLLGVSTSHYYRYIIIRYDWLKLRIIQLIPLVLLASFFLATVFYVVHTIISVYLIFGESYQFNLTDVLQNLINLSANYILWTLLYWSFHFIENYRKEEIKNLKWQATINEMELNKIKSQLNPHFIFNSMNSIRAMVDEDAGKAKNLIMHLSNILRSSLYMERKPVIPFDDEMSLVKDYLELEKTRLEERLSVELNVGKECSKFEVPPLLIQTLVENAIKHGIAKLEKGGELKIEANCEGAFLNIKIVNSGNLGQHINGRRGIGLKISRQRLKLLYGDEAGLELGNNNGKVVAKLTIPKINSVKIMEHESSNR